MPRNQAIRLLTPAAAWRRAGVFVLQLVALCLLSCLLVVTSVDVAVLAAGTAS